MVSVVPGGKMVWVRFYVFAVCSAKTFYTQCSTTAFVKYHAVKNNKKYPGKEKTQSANVGHNKNGVSH